MLYNIKDQDDKNSETAVSVEETAVFVSKH